MRRIHTAPRPMRQLSQRKIPLNMTTSHPHPKSASVDPAEVARFSAMAAQWWDPAGKFRPLHAINPVRLDYIRSRAEEQFGGVNPLTDLNALDIGCGGGLLCEPMARLGARVTGLDPSPRNIRIARTHADEQGLRINYLESTAEDLAATGETFDLVLNMAVLEHVADIDHFLAACSALIRPGGIMICATLNRTLKSFALAIIGAEYVLRWLPAGTHQWEKFITPAELRDALEKQGLSAHDLQGVSYNPLSRNWSASNDTDVNYLLSARKD